MKLPDHPEKYMRWSSLERRFLEPYFREITLLREKVKELEKVISDKAQEQP